MQEKNQTSILDDRGVKPIGAQQKANSPQTCDLQAGLEPRPQRWIARSPLLTLVAMVTYNLAENSLDEYSCHESKLKLFKLNTELPLALSLMNYS